MSVFTPGTRAEARALHSGRTLDVAERRTQKPEVTMVRIDLLKDLSDDDAERILALGSRRQFMAGNELFALGAQADGLFGIERGRVALTLPMQVEGCEQEVMVEERGGGQVVGWSGLIPPHRFTLRATAQLQTEVIFLAREVLLRHFAERPDVGYVVIRNVAAVIGQRLQVFQAMWLREMQRVIELRCS